MMEGFSFWDLIFFHEDTEQKMQPKALQDLHSLQFIVKTEPVHPIPCSSAHPSSYTGAPASTVRKTLGWLWM